MYICTVFRKRHAYLSNTEALCLLAHWKPEKFLNRAQGSMMVRAYSVGCLYHSSSKVFSGPPMEEWTYSTTLHYV